jgi:hypothetical protein
LLLLQVQLEGDRVVPLASFRGSVRPVLLAGSQGFISRALKASELFRTELQLRGISIVPVPLSSKDPDEKLRALKAEFRCCTYQAYICMIVCEQCLCQSLTR